MDAVDEEELLIKHYFEQGLTYNEILLFLEKYHGLTFAYRTFLRKLKVYGLKRRNNVGVNIGQISHYEIRNRILPLINGPGSAGGYRTVWHSLELDGVRVPREVVRVILKDLDPEATERRRRRRLKRRRYVNPGPNFAWHIDGYDKLKPWGFPIHGAMDGYSRRILWLKVTRSNNSPDNIASFFLSTVNDMEGCPVQLITDLGTENSIVAAIQAYFRKDENAHRYVSSQRNQRIECWWSQFCKQRASWWRHFFKELDDSGQIDTSSELSKEVLWYAFSKVIQSDLDKVRVHWNTHFIRKSLHQTVSGRPNSLYFLPEESGAEEYKKEVDIDEFNDVCQNVVERDYSNEYSRYLDYLLEHRHISEPTNWTDALDLYHYIMSLN